MGIRMMPEQFPERRRNDPKRRAEARVFDALVDLGLNGFGLYEFRFRREGKQVDNPLWVPSLGRFAVQVKGGTYEMDHRGQWFLVKPDGTRLPVQSPLEEAADGCMELRDGIRMATTFENFVAGVVIFTDMEPDDEIGHMARERYHVSVIWGLDSLQQDLERVADEVGFHRPPTPWAAENEWMKVHELQYGEDSGRAGASRDAPDPDQGPATGGAAEQQVSLGTATFHIQRLDRLIVMYYPPERDGDGRILLPET